jgi:hypothetical protein
LSANPDVVVNHGELTVAESLKAVLDDRLNHPDKRDHEIWISTAYFNPGGFELIGNSLEKAGKVRLLLGAEPEPPVQRPRELEQSETISERGRVRRALQGTLDEIERDRDLLGFSYEADQNATRLIEWLRSGKAEVKRFEKGFLHGKAFIVATDNEAVVAGSSNFTRAGLSQNEELNLGLYGSGGVGQVVEWFDRLWEQAEDFDLASIYASRYEEHSPWTIWMKMLWERYGAELEEQKHEQGDSRIRLPKFQQDGVWRAKRILRERHGVLIADGVGLGKTYLAGALLEDCVMNRRQRALVVVPAALRETWIKFQSDKGIQFDICSYNELASDLRLTENGDGREYLNQDPSEYSMIVLDEAHSVRNPDTSRNRAVWRLLEGEVPKDLVLLSATPVNNRLADLHELIRLFVRDDHAFAPAVPSLQKRFQEAEAEDPDDLTPDRLFDVIDAVAVRRTRQAIKEGYAGEQGTIEMNGKEVPIVFPKPEVREVTGFSVEQLHPGFIEQVEHILACDEDDADSCEHGEDLEGSPTLTLARYRPGIFRLEPDPSEVGHQNQFSGLLRTAVLKRFESSPHAFALTCERMANQHRAFLEVLDKEKKVASTDALDSWLATDTDDVEDWLDQQALADETELASAFDVEALRSAVAQDLALLENLHGVAAAIEPEDDPKLQRLADDLAELLDEAEEGATSDENARDRGKVIIFSFFADTAEWVRSYLEELFDTDDRFSKYRGRLAKVTGGNDGAKQDIVLRFAPKTAGGSATSRDDFDVLVSTDVLAEGLNLQQARNIINYDLPWNPMRLVQRHGRIDRLGSEHDTVVIRCMLDERLDDLLDLDRTLRNKVKKAAASIGVSDEILPGSKTSEIVFDDDREEIRRIQQEDASLFESGGERGDARSAEQYRRELAQAIGDRDGGESWLSHLPWGSGSGFRSDDVPAGTRRYLFCARVGDWDDAVFRMVDVTGEEPEGIAVSRDTHGTLGEARVARDEQRVLTDETHTTAYRAWDAARGDIAGEWRLARDPNEWRPEVPKALREAGALLVDTTPSGQDSNQALSLKRRIEVALPERLVKVFRRIIRDDGLSDQEKADRIAEEAKRQGLPTPADPKPIPEISEDDVHLVCWLAIEGSG